MNRFKSYKKVFFMSVIYLKEKTQGQEFNNKFEEIVYNKEELAKYINTMISDINKIINNFLIVELFDFQTIAN